MSFPACSCGHGQQRISISTRRRQGLEAHGARQDGEYAREHARGPAAAAGGLAEAAAGIPGGPRDAKRGPLPRRSRRRAEAGRIARRAHNGAPGQRAQCAEGTPGRALPRRAWRRRLPAGWGCHACARARARRAQQSARVRRTGHRTGAGAGLLPAAARVPAPRPSAGLVPAGSASPRRGKGALPGILLPRVSKGQAARVSLEYQKTRVATPAKGDSCSPVSPSFPPPVASFTSGVGHDVCTSGWGQKKHQTHQHAAHTATAS